MRPLFCLFAVLTLQSVALGQEIVLKGDRAAWMKFVSRPDKLIEITVHTDETVPNFVKVCKRVEVVNLRDYLHQYTLVAEALRPDADMGVSVRLFNDYITAFQEKTGLTPTLGNSRVAGTYILIFTEGSASISFSERDGGFKEFSKFKRLIPEDEFKWINP